MRVILAPMQGVLDDLVRELLSDVNDYDLCITEFLRVVNTLLPKKTFYRLCPELYNDGYTRSKTPVRVQLLGNSPEWMAENAVRAVELGSHGVDVNCGCPAKKVVGSEGGASLLKNPELIYRITRAIRKAIPSDKTLSVKVRLGWDSIAQRFEIADAVEQGGANEITIHGRTKTDGYRSDRINWPAINDIRQRLSIPVVANGEIWSHQDGQDCSAIAGCDALMLGRGALTIPNLGSVVKHRQDKMPWLHTLQLLKKYVQMDSVNDAGFYHIARTKQWLSYLKNEYPEAVDVFTKIRAIQDSSTLCHTILSL